MIAAIRQTCSVRLRVLRYITVRCFLVTMTLYTACPASNELFLHSLSAFQYMSFNRAMIYDFRSWAVCS